MTRPRKKIPVNVCWALWDPYEGAIKSWSVRRVRRESIKTIVGEDDDHPMAGDWTYWSKCHGWQCIRVRVVVPQDTAKKLKRKR